MLINQLQQLPSAETVASMPAPSAEAESSVATPINGSSSKIMTRRAATSIEVQSTSSIVSQDNNGNGCNFGTLRLTNQRKCANKQAVTRVVLYLKYQLERLRQLMPLPAGRHDHYKNLSWMFSPNGTVLNERMLSIGWENQAFHSQSAC